MNVWFLTDISLTDQKCFKWLILPFPFLQVLSRNEAWYYIPSLQQYFLRQRRKTALPAFQIKKNFLLRSLKILPSLIQKAVTPFLNIISNVRQYAAEDDNKLIITFGLFFSFFFSRVKISHLMWGRSQEILVGAVGFWLLFGIILLARSVKYPAFFFGEQMFSSREINSLEQCRAIFHYSWAIKNLRHLRRPAPIVNKNIF